MQTSSSLHAPQVDAACDYTLQLCHRFFGMSSAKDKTGLVNPAKFFKKDAKKILGKKSQFPVDKSAYVEYNNQAVASEAAHRGA
jgi:hypothetical protein